MTTIYVRSINPVRGLARITIARPRRTHRKAWLLWRVRHLMVPMTWLAERKPKGGIVYLTQFNDGDLGIR